MTLKQQRVLKELPNTNYNIAEAMRKAGYKEPSVRAGTQYRIIRRLTQKLDFFDPEKIKRDIESNRKEARAAKEHSVVANIDFQRSKIAGMITDKAEVKQTLSQEDQNKLLSLSKRLNLAITN